MGAAEGDPELVPRTGVGIPEKEINPERGRNSPKSSELEGGSGGA